MLLMSLNNVKDIMNNINNKISQVFLTLCQKWGLKCDSLVTIIDK